MSAAPSPSLRLVSHVLCPYVQRAAIVLSEKGLPVDREDIDLAAKPAWFLRLSPTGATPLLLVGDAPVWESAVIAEYLDETTSPRLHPEDALDRARHRAWIEFASGLLDLAWRLYTAPDEAALHAHADAMRARWRRVDAALENGEAPWFDGTRFRLVDAAFAPVFRYLDLFEREAGLLIADGLPRLAAWRDALSARPSVRSAVVADYPERLRAYVAGGGGAMARRIVEGRARAAVVAGTGNAAAPVGQPSRDAPPAA